MIQGQQEQQMETLCIENIEKYEIFLNNIVNRRPLSLIGFNFLQYFLYTILVAKTTTIDCVFSMYNATQSNLNELEYGKYLMLKYLKFVEGIIISNNPNLNILSEVIVAKDNCLGV